ncbi:hypothetical protein ACVW0P_004028 [Mucilaginibacter sp. UYNi724]
MLTIDPKVQECNKPSRFSKLMVVCLICCSSYSYSSTYYFSSKAGNDTYSSSQASNPATPWKSLDKLNSFFKYLKAGDSVLLKKGDIFYGSITVTKSGSYFAPIYFGAYGKGENPKISGLLTLNSWKNIGKGIYESICDAVGYNLILNNAQQQIGRYPNKGYLTIISSKNNELTDNDLIGAPNWTSADVVIRKARWIIDKSQIIAHNGNKLTFYGNKNNPKNGYGYFIQNSINTLDELGEWFYNPQKKTMAVYFGTKKPSAYTTSTSGISNLVEINKFNNISFENITFSGAGANAFKIIQSKSISITNCNIQYSGTEAIFASFSPFLTVKNCIINNSLSGGVNIDVGCTNASVLNNTIKNTGLMAGMGKSGTGTYEAITSFGDNTQIEKNRIDSVGYNGIYFGGNSSLAKNNYITWFCMTKDDGAGIYLGDWSKTTNKKVEGNIVLHGVGNSAGTNQPNSLQAEGIYIDDNTEGVSILDNTVSLCSNNGIKIHNAKFINIYGNTVFNNGIQLRLEQDHYLATSEYIRNNKISKNTFFSVGSAQAAAKFTTNQDDILSFGQIDSNIYCKPAKHYASAIISANMTAKRSVSSTKLKLQEAHGIDLQNTDKRNILFEYNATNTVKVISLDAHYVDVQNKSYSKTITLNPYSSMILLAAEPNEIDKLQAIEYSAVINKTFER